MALRQSSRDAFLAQVSRCATVGARSVDFAAIIDRIIAWSEQPGRGLAVLEPGDQHTVRYAIEENGVVLWAAYPRRRDGAKIVVLPGASASLAFGLREELISLLQAAVPGTRIEGTGKLQVPLERLASDRALRAFVGMLERARDALRT